VEISQVLQQVGREKSHRRVEGIGASAASPTWTFLRSREATEHAAHQISQVHQGSARTDGYT